MNTTPNKFYTMIDDCLNGNLKDFSVAVKKLTKPELLRYIEFAHSHYGVEYEYTLDDLRKALARR